MFRSLKLFVEQDLAIEDVIQSLVNFQYSKVKRVLQEGDFSLKGEVLDIFPVNFDGPVRIAWDEQTIRRIDSYNVRSGKSLWKHKIIIVLPKKSSSKEMSDPQFPLNNIIDIEGGDYVVHNNHGIGRFLGLQKIEINNISKEHLVIEYKGGDRLFVPKKDLHLVQKYIGFTKKPPRLFKLGSQEWKRIRSQIQKRLQRFAAELLRLQALRFSLKGYSFSVNTEWQFEFEQTFPFEETPDQTKASSEVKKDMEANHPMDRLICGDVGFGKTEVALSAIFKAIMDNKQVAVLVPTTILAEQHYYNFSSRLKTFPIKVAMLSRFRTKTQQTQIVSNLKSGAVDLVVGTHRLLSKDIQFKDLGLIVIDEEQRFGVRAKEKLKHLKLLVDVLTMTATPIPRTLYMALTGARDMSIISTPPKNRVPVYTHITEFDEDVLQDALKRELKRKGQIFFLHNRVEDIAQISKIIQHLVPKAKIAIAHGQMSSRLLEEIMIKFLQNKIDILVCTSIIESGIDIPNANTLIVNRADRFGLAELHQLRGRVGRSANQAYAYFIIPREKGLSEIAKTRLKALDKYSELGSGFQIAFEDLQIRGAGNLLGEQQSGYISAVGFDLYCRLLKQSIENVSNTPNNQGAVKK